MTCLPVGRDRTQGLKRGKSLQFKEVEPEKLAAIKKEIQQRAKFRRRAEYIFMLVLSLGVLGFLAYWLFR